MKKIIFFFMTAVVFSQTEAEETSEKLFNVYCGAGISENFTKSEYKMNFEVNDDNFPGGGGELKNDKNLHKVGYNLFLGIEGGEKFYWALETGANLSHAKHNKVFCGNESKEGGSDTVNPVTNLNITHGNEYELVAKFGGNFHSWRGYGIAGIGVKKVGVRYDYYPNDAFWNPDGSAERSEYGMYEDYPARESKTRCGFVIGAGIEKKVSDKFSVGLEYKYKAYKKLSFERDFRDIPEMKGWGAGAAERQGDLSPRKYKVSAGAHSIALRVSIHF